MKRKAAIVGMAPVDKTGFALSSDVTNLTYMPEDEDDQPNEVVMTSKHQKYFDELFQARCDGRKADWKDVVKLIDLVIEEETRGDRLKQSLQSIHGDCEN